MLVMSSRWLRRRGLWVEFSVALLTSPSSPAPSSTPPALPSPAAPPSATPLAAALLATDVHGVA
eukprot:scaffold161014_cov16-Tisochrysis_lutea.AAC.1